MPMSNETLFVANISLDKNEAGNCRISNTTTHQGYKKLKLLEISVE